MTRRTRSAVTSERLLRVGFEPWEGTFSNGRKANNKVHLDHDTLSKHPRLYQDVVAAMCELAEPHRPDFFVGVPNGAVGIARAVAMECGLPVFAFNPRLKKDPETGEMDYYDPVSRAAVGSLGSGVLIEDVLRTGSNIQKAMKVSGLASKIAVGICVLDRSVAASEEPGDRLLKLPIDMLSVARQPIPSMLEIDSVLWAYAAQSAGATA